MVSKRAALPRGSKESSVSSRGSLNMARAPWAMCALSGMNVSKVSVDVANGIKEYEERTENGRKNETQ